MELTLNSATNICVSGPTGSLTDVSVFVDGGAFSGSVSVTKIGAAGQGVWRVGFTPNATGIYSIYADGKVQFQAPCVAKSLQARVADVEDAALGSWQWDKTTGALTLYRLNGSVLMTYSVEDSVSAASREKLS